MGLERKIYGKIFLRVVFAAVLLMAFIFNPLAMRAHMANAGTVAGIEAGIVDQVMDPALHAEHAKAPESPADICPQMAPCIAVLAQFNGALLDEAPLAIRNTGEGKLANGRIPPPPYHPPIA